MSTINFSHIASIYKEYLDSLYSYALHLGFEEQTAMDAIHDIFYKLCTNESLFNDINNLKFYLFRTLRNRLIDIKRTSREHLWLLPADEIIDDNMPFQLNVTVEDEFIMSEDAEEIKQNIENILDRLTDRQREIIFLRYIQECSYEEISEIMQISVAAGRNLVSKSIAKLRVASFSLSIFMLFVN